MPKMAQQHGFDCVLKWLLRGPLAKVGRVFFIWGPILLFTDLLMHEKSNSAIGMVSIFEGCKGVVEQAHLDPASKYPGIFLDAASRVANTKVAFLAIRAALYSLIRRVAA